MLKNSTEISSLSILNGDDDTPDSSHLRLILEETMSEMRRKSWPQVVGRVKSQNLRSVFMGVTKEGVIRFKTTSGTTPGKWWIQDIYFEDLPEVVQILLEDPSFTARDALLLAMKGDVKVHCNCLAWKYWGFQYIGTKNRYALRQEMRYPKKRNPNLTGAACKHLISVFSVIAFDWPRIVSSLRKKGILPKYRKRKKVVKR